MSSDGVLLFVGTAFALFACALPGASNVDGSGGSSTGTGAAAGGQAGGTGGAGAVGQGGDAVCTPSGHWPDSTPRCSDGTGPPCPYAGEDGSVVAVAQDYAPSGGTVVDGVTGLEWQASATTSGENWSEANSACANLGGGFRLPTLLELSSLVDYGTSPSSPAPFSQEMQLFWTSSAHPTGNHWGVNFTDGLVAGWGNVAPGSLNARCVRGTTVASQITVQASAACDDTTGLAWELEVSGTYDWPGALDHCTTLGPGWRLPSAKELITIYVPDQTNHLAGAFPVSEPGGTYWSSTPAFADTNKAWAVDFSAQTLLQPGASKYARASSFHARCVHTP